MALTSCLRNRFRALQQLAHSRPDLGDADFGHGNCLIATVIGSRMFHDTKFRMQGGRKAPAAMTAMVQSDHGDAKRAGKVCRPGVHAYIERELRHDGGGHAQIKLPRGDKHMSSKLASQA
jgi:hypothetical protein